MTRLSVIVGDDYESVSRVGADFVVGLVSAWPKATVVAATGESPIGLYRELALRRQARKFDASSIRVFQLDEYLGIGPEDRRSLFGWMIRSFVAPLRIPSEHVIRFSADGDAATGCAAYERALEEAGGYDLAVLGIGMNGHIGFNEPPSDATAPTREVELSPESIQSNARYWGGPEQVPRRAVTAGMAALLGARRILLVATGPHKRDIVHRALHGPVTPQVPASYLQQVEDATVLLDRDAWNRPEASGSE